MELANTIMRTRVKGAGLKESTKHLMNVLKKIRNKQGARSLPSKNYRGLYSGSERHHLAQSHRQLKKSVPSKAYRDSLKRGNY